MPAVFGENEIEPREGLPEVFRRPLGYVAGCAGHGAVLNKAIVNWLITHVLGIDKLFADHYNTWQKK